MFGADCGTEHLVLPVGVGIAQFGRQIVAPQLVRILAEFVSVQHIVTLLGGSYRYRTAIAYARSLTFFTFLGGDDDDTV